MFSAAADIQWATSLLTTANTAMDGTGTVLLCFTADASNGGFVQKIIAKPVGTNVASVLRIFLNNGLTPTTASNNSLIAEITLPASTANAAAALQQFDMNLNYAINAGYKLYATIGTTVVAGYQLTTIGSKY